MGLNFGYLLYFKQKHIWDVLQGFLTLAERFDPSTKILFPDHMLEIPLEPLSAGSEGYRYDDSEIEFFTCIPFEEDSTLTEFYETFKQERIKRSPPKSSESEKITICEIILSIHQKLPEDTQNEYVLFEFDTVGTWMSLLFEKSTSIRKTFIEFLEKNDGICGVFNLEFGGGNVFWHKSKRYNIHIDNQFLLPDDIETLLRKENV